MRRVALSSQRASWPLPQFATWLAEQSATALMEVAGGAGAGKPLPALTLRRLGHAAWSQAALRWHARGREVFRKRPLLPGLVRRAWPLPPVLLQEGAWHAAQIVRCVVAAAAVLGLRDSPAAAPTCTIPHLHHSDGRLPTLADLIPPLADVPVRDADVAALQRAAQGTAAARVMRALRGWGWGWGQGIADAAPGEGDTGTGERRGEGSPEGRAPPAKGKASNAPAAADSAPAAGVPDRSSSPSPRWTGHRDSDADEGLPSLSYGEGAAGGKRGSAEYTATGRDWGQLPAVVSMRGCG